MQANISLVFNLLLLAGVIYAIFRILKKQPSTESNEIAPSGSNSTERDDIIAIRKIPSQPAEKTINLTQPVTDEKPARSVKNHQLYFLVPNKQTHFQGYELLQSLLAVKLRFGEGNFFHYYQQQNGITESVFTVTATSQTGEFDLNQMHSFKTRGLCLFIEAKPEESKNEEALKILLDSAHILAQKLDATLLNEHQKPINAAPNETKAAITA